MSGYVIKVPLFGNVAHRRGGRGAFVKYLREDDGAVVLRFGTALRGAHKWPTIELAEEIAFMLAVENPNWIGRMDVLEVVHPVRPGGAWRSKRVRGESDRPKL